MVPWVRNGGKPRTTRDLGSRAALLAALVCVCLVCIVLAACGTGAAADAPAPSGAATPTTTSAARPTTTPTYAQAALAVAQSSGAAGSVSVTVTGTAITVHDEIGAQPDLSSARDAVLAEAFAIQRGLWESLLHPSSVTVIVSAPSLAGAPQSAPLGTCTLTAGKVATVLWSAETPLDAWAYVYNSADLINILKPGCADAECR